MKKKIITLLLVASSMIMLTACQISLQPTCKASDCEETSIYKDGYCKYHYYLKNGEDIIKDIFN